jgi:hypothetical protein
VPEKPKAMYRVVINGSLEEVWNEITRRDAPIPAFFNSQLHAETLTAGSPMAMRTGSGKYTSVVGKIIEFKPMTRFSHTFKFTNYDDPECIVIYDLLPVQNGVQFTLTIEDLPEGTKTAKQMITGSKMIVNTLKAVIETGRPTFGIRLLYRLFKVLEPISPKACKSENWPLNKK